MNRTEAIAGYFESMGAMRRMLFQAHGHGDSPAAKHLPTRAQFGLLMMLDHHKGIGMRDIADKFCMSSSAATQLVDGLVKDGLLLRKGDSEDRRKIGVSITAKGKKMLEIARKTNLESLAQLLKPLTDAELKELLRLQQKITASIPHA